MHGYEKSFKTAVKSLSDEEDEFSGKVETKDKCVDYVCLPSLQSHDDTLKRLKGFEEKNKSMADGPANRSQTSLCCLPYAVTRELMTSMDTDKGWECLAAQAGFAFDRIQHLALRQHQADGSPTRTLLWELGSQGYKVIDLYQKLSLESRRREMQIIEAYVNEGHVNRGASAAAHKYSSGLSSSSPLPLFLNQIKVPNRPPVGHAEYGSFGHGGSEVNFNHPSFVSQCQTKAAGAKNYDDKVIPGTEEPISGLPFSPGMSRQTLHSIPNSQQGKNSFPSLQPSRLEPTESSDKTTSSGHTSLPSFLPSSLSSGNSAHSSTTTGAATLQAMLKNGSLSPNQRIPPASLQDNFQQGHAGKENSSPSLGSMPSLHRPSGNATQRQSSIASSASSECSGMSEADVAMSVKASFSYKELYDATGGFSAKNILGEGAFGTVFKGTVGQLDCAIKRLNTTINDSEEKTKHIKSELAALLRYQHENIVTLYALALDGPQTCLVYQCLTNGSLEDRLSRKNGTPPVNWERRLNILLGACKGLNFLHTVGDQPLIHGDIKSANILLDQYLEAKIGDLGQAMHANSVSSEGTAFTHITIADTSTKQYGTKAYYAPEIISGGKWSIKSDVYAMGVVFLEVCSGLKAHDVNRGYNFLADFFQSHVLEKHESTWIQALDKELDCVPNVNFLEVLKLAARAIKRLKKQRPDSEKLLKEIKVIYENYKSDEIDRSSLTSSMRIDSTMSNKEYLESGDSQQTSSVPPMSSVQNLQEEMLRQCGSQKRLQGETSLRQHLEGNSTPPLANSSEMNQTTCGDPDSPIRSFPQNEPLPEPFKLQAAYDKQPQRQRIDRLSGIVSRNEDTQIEEFYPSDPEKLQKLDEFDQQQQGQTYRNVPPQSHAVESQLTDSFPKSDPKKLAQLYTFDQANEDTNVNFVDHPCDPKKLAYLTGSHSATLPEKSPSTQNTTETSLVRPGEQQMSSNTFTKDCPSDPNDTSSIFLSSNAWDPNIEPREEEAPSTNLTHCPDHRLSCDSNMVEEGTASPYRGEDKENQKGKTLPTLPVMDKKSKMDNLFSKYFEGQKNFFNDKEEEEDGYSCDEGDDAGII